MAIHTQIVLEPAYVCLRCEGSFSSVSELLQVFDEAFRAAGQNQRERILVDGSAISGKNISTVERFKIGTFLSEINSTIPMNIAALAVVAPGPLVEPERFGETVARNRGVNGRAFTDIAEAIAWINAV